MFVRILKPNGEIVEVDEKYVQIALKVSKGKVMTEEDIINNSVIKPPKPEDTSLICPICGYKAKNEKALRMHKFSKHERKAKK
ncbi:MAG TPA: hypothetical protein PKZ10_02130 [Candidatus Pacearchaeota archaeon]|jgi:hypothetical protein|nr:hypothetical protein [Thermodesulfovibrio thiophilus]HQD89270.1 hypothetical protein [Candidatus Pacearchaeota archaeon]